MKASIIPLALGLAFGSAAYATTVFDYTIGNLGQGSGNNSIVRTQGNETVTATAVAMTGNNSTTFQWATLGQYSGFGLGVCDQLEVNCGSPQHEVDDSGQLDFVMFHFSAMVTSVSITVTPVCNCDTNASYYVGNGFSPMGQTLLQLGGATNSTEGSKNTTRTITLTGLGNGVDSVLFGASVIGNNNFFKIESLSVTQAATAPEPGTMAMAGAALIGLGLLGRKRS